MRTLIRTALVCALVTGAGACNRHDDKGMDKANSQMQKAAEDLGSQRQDVVKDENDLAAARDRYVTAARDRLSKLDAKIDELGAKAEAKGHAAVPALKARRDELAHDVDIAKDHASKDWASFQKSVDDEFDKLENDVNDALK